MLGDPRVGQKKWARQDSNLGPRDYESPALTAELQARIFQVEDYRVLNRGPTTKASGLLNR
jgi:hypothetical protein